MLADEFDHEDRDINYDIPRQKAIEKKCGCKFNRINPDKEHFTTFKPIDKIQRHIGKQSKELTKKSLKNNLSRGLLELEFK